MQGNSLHLTSRDQLKHKYSEQVWITLLNWVTPTRRTCFGPTHFLNVGIKLIRTVNHIYSIKVWLTLADKVKLTWCS